MLPLVLMRNVSLEGKEHPTAKSRAVLTIMSLGNGESKWDELIR